MYAATCSNLLHGAKTEILQPSKSARAVASSLVTRIALSSPQRSIEKNGLNGEPSGLTRICGLPSGTCKLNWLQSRKTLDDLFVPCCTVELRPSNLPEATRQPRRVGDPHHLAPSEVNRRQLSRIELATHPPINLRNVFATDTSKVRAEAPSLRPRQDGQKGHRERRPLFC